jgi:hypothetical protein
MFVVDAVSDPLAAARVARLMFNIEQNARVFEWLGDLAAPPRRPAADESFLTVEVPSEVDGAPPLEVDVRPAVGYVFCSPSVAHTFARDVERLLSELDAAANLPCRRFAPIASTPLASVVSHNIAGADFPPRAVHPRFPSDERSSATKIFLKAFSSATSYLAKFTWYFVPTAVADCLRLESTPQFLAAVASVLVDADVGGVSTPAPIYRCTPDLWFPVTREARRVEDALAAQNLSVRVYRPDYNPDPPAGATCGMCARPLWGEVYTVRSTLGPAPHTMPICFFCAGAPTPWRPPLHGAAGASVEEVPAGATCGMCALPLWGEVYAVRSKLIEPHTMPICFSCAGALGGWSDDSLLTSRNERPIFLPRWCESASPAQACARTALKDLVPLLESECEVFAPESCAAMVPACFVRLGAENSGSAERAEHAEHAGPADPAGVAGCFIELRPNSPLPFHLPPPFRYDALRGFRGCTIFCNSMAAAFDG